MKDNFEFFRANPDRRYQLPACDERRMPLLAGTWLYRRRGIAGLHAIVRYDLQLKRCKKSSGRPNRLAIWTRATPWPHGGLGEVLVAAFTALNLLPSMAATA
jgi:hypothetical protein